MIINFIIMYRDSNDNWLAGRMHMIIMMWLHGCFDKSNEESLSNDLRNKKSFSKIELEHFTTGDVCVH